jgi:hypothetical protein
MNDEIDPLQKKSAKTDAERKQKQRLRLKGLNEGTLNTSLYEQAKT